MQGDRGPAVVHDQLQLLVGGRDAYGLLARRVDQIDPVPQPGDHRAAVDPPGAAVDQIHRTLGHGVHAVEKAADHRRAGRSPPARTPPAPRRRLRATPASRGPCPHPAARSAPSRSRSRQTARETSASPDPAFSGSAASLTWPITIPAGALPRRTRRQAEHRPVPPAGHRERRRVAGHRIEAVPGGGDRVLPVERLPQPVDAHRCPGAQLGIPRAVPSNSANELASSSASAFAASSTSAWVRYGTSVAT